ncbi:glycine-rich protein 5-like [Pollicipes pollicipes]|uniref:glycine-rich protein 5-like n=1 Tax=Pollicipes pollicipes TaxID=41117 RepID=UPI0018854D1F|nr:glycine-rich protein 5-like [Pollicipes pollicipes]
MWTTVLAALALAHAGHGFVLSGFSVPGSPDYGSTVHLEADYRLGRGEYIKKMRWFKDGNVFMSYSQRPDEFYNWTPVDGINIDRAASSSSNVVLTNVQDGASGQYTLEVQVYGPGGNVANIVNSQSMSVGGGGGLGTRFGGGSAGGVGGTTFFQSSSTGAAFPGGLGTATTFQGTTGGGSFQSATVGGHPGGTHTSFQSAAAAGSVGPDGLGIRAGFQSGGAPVGPDVAQTIQSALAEAQAQIQNTVNQINQLQQALAGIGY